MIIKREELYEKLKQVCPGKYSVGLHGISTSRAKDFYNLENYEPTEISEIIASKIMKTGLKVESGRTINGTVAFFGRLDDRRDLQKTFNKLCNYIYGANNDYIIVATPVELTCEDGRVLYAGATNLESKYKIFFDTTGNETSTIYDKVALANGAIIDPKFILGRFKIQNDESIELLINERHLSQTNKKIPTEEFNEYINRLYGDLYFLHPNLTNSILEKNLETIKTITEPIKYNPGHYAYLLETLNQLENENNIKDLIDEDYQQLEILKNNYIETQNKIKNYEAEKKKKLANMANYSLEEIIDFVQNNHPTYFQDFPDSIKNNIDIMREVTKTPNLNSFIIYYVGKDVQNDPESMINLANNCSIHNFDDYLKDDWFYKARTPNKSDLGYEVIGLDVRTDKRFWETLNTRILEINKENKTHFPYFDTEKEITLARLEKTKTKK